MELATVVQQFIDRHRLLSPQGHYLVALSGGADSVCLLLLLRELGYRVEAVHCNFKLRGSESDRDEQFVRDLCRENDVPLHLTHFDTAFYASLHHLSIEMAARQLRYAYFDQLLHDIGADAICVAHHQDDAAETVLLNLIRGTGLHGLTGIKPRNGHVLRPLLCVGRRDIEKWLADRRQAYVTDSTNLQIDAVRNRLRLQVIPLLEQAHQGAVQNILDTARHLSEASLVYDHAVDAALSSLLCQQRISIARLVDHPSIESILHHWLHPLGFTPPVIEDVACHVAPTASSSASTGKVWQSATHQLTIHQGFLCCQPIVPLPSPLVVPETGTYVSGRQRLRVSITTGAEVVKRLEAASLDADKVRFPLTLRPIQAGDRFQPFGMKGSKLISDYLTDCHVMRFDRQRQLVVTDADGVIVWLCGHRVDGRFAVTEATQRTLLLVLERDNQ